jgi:hypothetical protein
VGEVRNGDGQKCDEDRGGSVACVDKRREKRGASIAHVAIGGGERGGGRRERGHGGRRLLKRRRGRQGRGGGRGSGATRGWENEKERGGPGRWWG